MLACFVCFTLRALLLADLVQAQAEGEDSGDFAKGWKRCGARSAAFTLAGALPHTGTIANVRQHAPAIFFLLHTCGTVALSLSPECAVLLRLAFGPAGSVLDSPGFDVGAKTRASFFPFCCRWERDMKVEWALHVIPCVAMLYLMRKAGEPTASSSNGGREYENRGSDERTGIVGREADEAGRGSGAATKDMYEGAERMAGYGNYGSGR